jgi:hypothetical protein
MESRYGFHLKYYGLKKKIKTCPIFGRLQVIPHSLHCTGSATSSSNSSWATPSCTEQDAVWFDAQSARKLPYPYQKSSFRHCLKILQFTTNFLHPYNLEFRFHNMRTTILYNRPHFWASVQFQHFLSYYSYL